ncbi:MAG: hypothetical protein WCS01_15050 [bacterium]
MGIKIEDLPPRLQAQARAQIERDKRPESRSQYPEVRMLESGEDRRTECASHIEHLSREDRRTECRSHIARGQRRVPNKTEADYQRYHLRGMDARFEAVTFRMANGHRYTPDWVVFADGRPVACHECKGGYALHSQQRARLAFDQVRVEYPGLVWVWAVKTPAGWQVTTL